MEYTLYCPPFGEVALRKESVDRNYRRRMHMQATFYVALRKESVDRNMRSWRITTRTMVALRKESVDRNPLLRSC